MTSERQVGIAAAEGGRKRGSSYNSGSYASFAGKLSALRRVPVPLYWVLYVALVAWFVVSGLHLVRAPIWVPLFFMMVLDWFMTRDSQLRYVFAAFLMLAILLIMIVDFFVAPGAPYSVRSAYLVLAFLMAFMGYQLLLWRKVLRRRQ